MNKYIILTIPWKPEDLRKKESVKARSLFFQEDAARLYCERMNAEKENKDLVFTYIDLKRHKEYIEMSPPIKKEVARYLKYHETLY